MAYLLFCGPHFHWKLVSKKALLRVPDMYSEQSSFQVNFLVQEDHESSTIDAGLLLGTKKIRDKHLNKSSKWFVKSSILGALTCSWKLSRTFILTQLTGCSVSEDEQFSVSFSKFHSNCAFSRISKCIL